MTTVMQVAYVRIKPGMENVWSKATYDRVEEWLKHWTCRANFKACIERERTARKTAQESLENYKGECTRLQHKVDRLKGEARLINRREHEATELRPAL